MISEYLGDATVSYDLPSINPSVGEQAASYSISENVQLTGRALLSPDEVIRRLSATDLTKSRPAIHFIRSAPPAVAHIPSEPRWIIVFTNWINLPCKKLCDTTVVAAFKVNHENLNLHTESAESLIQNQNESCVNFTTEPFLYDWHRFGEEYFT